MKTRVLTALVLILVVLGVVLCTSPWPFFVLASAMALLGAYEIALLAKAHYEHLPLLFLVPFCFPLILLFPEALGQHAVGFVLPWAPLALLAFGVLSCSQLKRAEFYAFSGLWVAGPVLALLWLHGLASPQHAFSWQQPVLLAMVPLWGGDTAAIFAGKAFGKHLLAPTISPKRTVEGSIANLLACIAVAIPLAIWLNYTWVTGLACGLCAGILGQAGDLFESALKRRAGVKDSGTLLPGHGGILDRIDSLLFTAPAVAYILLR